MYKLNFKKRVWVVKQKIKGVPTPKIALSQNVSLRTVQILIKTYKQSGWDDLKDHKTGRPETILNLKHCLARVNRPQTNEKVERFFRTYKEEYITNTFSSLNDFIKHYNRVRIHMSFHYKTPKEVWNELVS